MLATQTVTVLRPSTSKDEWGRQSSSWAEEEVPGVLWFQSLTADANADGVDVHAGDSMDAGFHFPKAYRKPLAGCRIRIPDGTVWEVVGDPHGHMDENVPGPWDRSFTARRHTGKEGA